MTIMDEVSFPRGNKLQNSKSSNTVAKKKKLDKSDNLFKDPVVKKKKKKTNKKVPKEDEEEEYVKKPELILEQVEKEEGLLTSVEPLSQKLISEGMRVLCQIQEIRELDMLVSLPGRLIATIPITNISTPYSKLLDQLSKGEDIDIRSLKELFSIGEILPCYLKEVSRDDSHKVTASFNPSDVNKEIPLTALSQGMKLLASVESIEDHGYVIDVGIPCVRCFMTKQSAGDQLTVGQLIQGYVSQCQVDGPVGNITLSLEPVKPPKKVKDINISTLLPGSKLEVAVERVINGGLMVSFHSLTGYVHKDHLISFSDQLSQYSRGQQFTGIVLYSLPLINAVYFSLKKSLIDPNSVQQQIKRLQLGQFVDKAQVVESTSAGLFMKLNANSRGFIPLRHLNDNLDDIEKLLSKHPVGLVKRCRILQYAAMDECYICTFKKSLLKQKIIRYDGFKVGELVEATVRSLGPTGLNVELGKNLFGFVPKLHWADDPRLKKPELRFKPGDKLQCKVLKVNPERKQLHLTCKKTLIESSDPVYDNISQLKPHMELKGTICLIQSGGLLVSFYGDLTGWVPKVFLGTHQIQEISTAFYTGQVVSCVVKSIDETKGRVVVSLKKNDSNDTPKIPLGTVIKCRVEDVILDDDNPGLKVVDVTSLINGFIPVEHLSDFPHLCRSLLETYQKNDEIPEAIWWSRSDPQPIVSLKPRLIEFAKEKKFPNSLEEIEIGTVFPCVYSQWREFGAFATLLRPPTTQNVLFPSSKLTTRLKSLFATPLKGLTMEGAVVRIDTGAKKVSMSALPKDVPQQQQKTLLEYLKDMSKIERSLAKGSDNELVQIIRLKKGETVVGRVSAEFEPDIDLQAQLPNGLTAVVPVYHYEGKSFKENDVVFGCVLHRDLFQRTVYISLREDVLNMMKHKPKFVEEEKGTVLFNTEYFSVVLLRGRLVYVPFIGSLNEVVVPIHPPFPIGSKVLISVTKTEYGYIGTFKAGISVASKRKRTASECSQQSNSPQKKVKKNGPKKTANVAHKEQTGAQLEQTKSSVSGNEKEDKANSITSTADKNTSVKKSNSSTNDGGSQTVDVRLEKDVQLKKEKNKIEKVPRSNLPRLQIDSRFQWDEEDAPLNVPTGPLVDTSDSEDETEEKECVTAKDRREKARLNLEKARQEEKALEAIEEDLTKPDRTPTTVDDYDRMVLASPNSSILWLQYMAFHLGNANIEQARAVAQRALKSIAFREEQEKFNIWMAWLNLEHMYGTKESYDNLFQESLAANDPMKVYSQMAANFAKEGKMEEADSLYNTMLKKFKKDKNVWVQACMFYMKSGKLEAARNVFQRSLLSLDKKEHIDMISRFAQMEVKFGDVERGKTMFDTMMMNYPKRTDLWLVYVDTLTKSGDIEHARKILERCITLELPVKKMKCMFQKFLDFETRHGDEEKQDYVRQKALQYIESKSSLESESTTTT